MTQLNPTFGKTIADGAALSAALGLEPSAFEAQRAPAQEVNCGSNFMIVPVSTRKAVDAAAIDRAKTDAVFAAAGIQRRGIYIFSTERGQDDAVAYSRLPGGGGLERSGDGIAAGPTGCFITKPASCRPTGERHCVSSGRARAAAQPHQVSVTMTGGAITQVKVGGPAVVVGEGGVTVPAP
jgi:predicted PhzF superfamily epimerase YddE/YHI9